MATVDVRLATVDGSVTVEVSGRPFGGRVCATTVFTTDRDTYCTKNQKSLSNVVVQRSYQGVIPMVLIESRK